MIEQTDSPTATAENSSQWGVLALTVAVAIGIGFAVSLTILCAMHIWNVDYQGRPIVNDFVSYWSAGQLALHGKAAAAYDPFLRHAAEIATVRHPFPDIIGWWYPPLFLFVAAALALFPYGIAFVVMNDATLLFHFAVTALITRRWAAAFLVVVPPWAMLGMTYGQDQFLTASIIGAVLLTLEGQPALSGLLLGLLTYKPQLGLLFPIALAFGGHWRVFGWACVGTLLWTALSGVVFGFDTLTAFVHGLSVVSRRVLETNPAYLGNLQSLYGIARSFGVPERPSWVAQLCLSCACMIVVAGLWRSRTPFNLKAAGLAIAVPLTTPYVWAPDLVTLSVALSFLFRHRRFGQMEWLAIVIALLGGGYFVAFGPKTLHFTGIISCLLIGAIVWRRVREFRGIVFTHSAASVFGAVSISPTINA